MGRPVILVADDDATDRRRVEDELDRRYAVDYDVRGAGSVDEALTLLGDLRVDGAEVALVLARQRPGGLPGIDLLQRMRSLHPGAQRVVLINWGEQVQRSAAAELAAAPGRRLAQ